MFTIADVKSSINMMILMHF